MNHLTDRQITQYLSQTLSPAERLATGSHLAECEACREACLARRDEARPVREALLGLRADLEEAAGDHLTYEQIAGAVDGTLDDVEMEIAESHLAVCENCARECRDLRRFGRSFARPAASAPKAPWYWSPFVWAGAAIAATLLLIVLPLGLETWRAKSEIAGLRRAASEAESRPRPVGVAADPCSLALPPAVRGLVREAAATGRLEVSPRIESLRDREGVLLGPAASGGTIQLLGPLGEFVLTRQPEFRWSAPAGATAIRVSVFDENLNPVAASGPLSGSGWIPPSPLARGRVYLWQIQATLDGKEILVPSPPVPAARFAVLDTVRARELEAAKEQFAGLPLVLGILYAKEGVLTEARAYLRLAREANPDSDVVKMLANQADTAIQKPAPATANPAQ